jgi:hypothetical protein
VRDLGKRGARIDRARRIDGLIIGRDLLRCMRLNLAHRRSSGVAPRSLLIKAWRTRFAQVGLPTANKYVGLRAGLQ